MEGIFYMVVRIFVDSTNHNSVEYFKAEDYDNMDRLREAAAARFHNIISADLQNPSVVYQQAFVIDNGGNFIDMPVIFDRREQNEG